jgi:DNA-binding XRE family transcriptional regulator
MKQDSAQTLFRVFRVFRGENCPAGRGVQMSVQIIKQGNKPEWAVVPYKIYLELVEKAEMLQDVQDYDNAKAALERGDEALIPGEVVHAILDGDNPIRVWRDYRGMSQQETAEKAGISVPYLSQLETDKRKGSLNVLSAIAKVLQVSLENIVTSQT